MRLGNSAATLVAVLAIGAVIASSASAAITTEAAQWYTGTTEAGVTTLNEDKAITAEIAEHPGIGKKFELKTTFGINNVPIRFTATAVECVECKITNEEVTGEAGKVAIGKVQFRFTGMTVDEPADCTVNGVNEAEGSEPVGTLTTRPLTFHADWMHEGKAFQQFFPTKQGGPFFTYQLVGAGCGIAGKYNVSGSLFSQTTNATGVFKTEQYDLFSQAIQATTGGELRVVHRLELTGTINLKAGGQFFGIK